MAMGTSDVLGTVAHLSGQGVEFVQSKSVHTENRGALTKTWFGGVSFELVHDERV
jgi:4-hydroxyphenylpyruvate dioxygenase